jgi:hypothetical protein
MLAAGIPLAIRLHKVTPRPPFSKSAPGEGDLPSIHPGEILSEEFMTPLSIGGQAEFKFPDGLAIDAPCIATALEGRTPEERDLAGISSAGFGSALGQHEP